MDMDLDMCDTSDYLEEHPLYSRQNKKKLCEFKDESNDMVISEFVGLRSSMYSIRHSDGSIKKTWKGIKRAVLNRTLHMRDYLESLYEQKDVSVRSICM
jgi:hypothetical protein